MHPTSQDQQKNKNETIFFPIRQIPYKLQKKKKKKKEENRVFK
jgi:hypothetical protein